jgi:hypothetical protein
MKVLFFALFATTTPLCSTCSAVSLRTVLARAQAQVAGSERRRNGRKNHPEDRRQLTASNSQEALFESAII